MIRMFLHPDYYPHVLDGDDIDVHIGEIPALTI